MAILLAMDEILIEEKKYVSSKQAAKVTGYAKDYIGQLCREGRVPARLIGRSWYVLESAIHDHRFGKEEIEPESMIRSASRPLKNAISLNWESPRYEAFLAEKLPSVNRLRNVDSSSAENVENVQNEASQHLQDSWKAWFDRVVDSEVVVDTPGEIVQEVEEVKEGEEVHIPIHTVYELPPETLLPRRRPETSLQYGMQKEQKQGVKSGGIAGFAKVTGTLFAVLMAVLAAIGTGYFDKYIVSVSQASVISGIIFYIK